MARFARMAGRFAGIVVLMLLGSCTERPCGIVGDMCLLAGTGKHGFNRDGLPPESTDLFLPSAARRGPDGSLYIMDFNNQRLRRIDDEGHVNTVIGSGVHAIAATGIPVLETPLENPVDFDFFADGRLVFVSYHDPRVLAVADDGTLQALAGAGDGVTGVSGDEGDGGPASEALFIQLDGIAIAEDDSIYVSDSLANRVRRIRDGMITTVAGTGAPAFGGDGGEGTEAALHWPTALELDPEGNLFIADTLNHAIRRLAVDGTITTVAGTGVEGAGGRGGLATRAQLSQPFGIALDPDGSFYIADRGNFEVHQVGPDGILETIAGTGSEGGIQGGPATSTRFGHTARITLDGDDLLVADQSNSVIWRIVLR